MSCMSWKRQPENSAEGYAGYQSINLTFTYLIALLLPGVLVIASYAIIQLTFYEHDTDAPVINLSGRKGKGTTFFIRLPLNGNN